MNKDAIVKTAITRWSDEDDCFVTESPLAPTIVGCGDTEQEAYDAFLTHIEANYEAYEQGKHAIYSKAGRPQKGKIKFNAEIAPEIKHEIAALAKRIGISQGETVEFLYSFYNAHHTKSHSV